MINIFVLFTTVVTFFLYMIPGFILRKTKLASDNFAKEVSVLLLYIAQPAMFLHSFAIRFNGDTFISVIYAFVFSFIAHSVFYLLARPMFKKAPKKMRKVLKYAVIFSNAGYMGIPIISDVFGEEFVIYATVYVMWFNLFAFSLGRYIYTEDNTYISLKSLINPAIISIFIGAVIYLTGIGTFIQDNYETNTVVKIIYTIITMLKNMIAPLSMTVVGVRLADIDFKGVFKDKYLYLSQFVRLLLFPAVIWAIMRPFYYFNIISSDVIAIVTILASTPSAAFTTIFAELYGGDSPYAGKLVAISTLASLITMPIAALLLYI